MTKLQFTQEMDALYNKQKVLKELLAKMTSIHKQAVKLSKNGINGINEDMEKGLIEYKDLSAEALKLMEQIKKDSKLISDHFMK